MSEKCECLYLSTECDYCKNLHRQSIEDDNLSEFSAIVSVLRRPPETWVNHFHDMQERAAVYATAANLLELLRGDSRRLLHELNMALARIEELTDVPPPMSVAETHCPEPPISDLESALIESPAVMPPIGDRKFGFLRRALFAMRRARGEAV